MPRRSSTSRLPSPAGLLLCYLGFLSAPAEASFRRTPFTAFAQVSTQAIAQGTKSRVSTSSLVAFPQQSTNAPISEVEVKPDLRTAEFSAQNAFYFATLSKIAYRPEKEARGLLQGNSTCEGLGFDRFHWFEAGDDAKKRTFDAIHDTEAYVAANDDMIAVVFRGTKEAPDWATNLNVRRRDVPESWGMQSGVVHEGFDDGVDTVWETLGMRKTIKALYDEEGKSRKLYIAGHSLGGALATIAAARLVFEDDLNVAGMYTMGSPSVFDSDAAADFDAKMNHGTPMKHKYFRCRNNNDIVPRVPLTMTHVGTEIYLDRFGAVSTSSLADRLLGRLSAISRGEVIDGVDDHKSSEYTRLFQQVAINSRVPLLEKAVSAFGDAVADSVLKIAPDEVVENSEPLRRLKTIKSVVEEAKGVAKEAAMEF